MTTQPLKDLYTTARQATDGALTRTVGRIANTVQEQRATWRRRLALVQGGYYFVTGVWPFLHMRSFEAVTGPKTDRWLVQTVGALVGVLGGALITSGQREEGPSHDLASTAAASAVALGALEIVFVAQKRISPVYLLDAAAEGALVGGWMMVRSEHPAASSDERRSAQA